MKEEIVNKQFEFLTKGIKETRKEKMNIEQRKIVEIWYFICDIKDDISDKQIMIRVCNFFHCKESDVYEALRLDDRKDEEKIRK